MVADITYHGVGLGSSVDFSLMSLFLRADIVVKSVIIILIAASIYSWAIIIEKFKMFKKINQSTVEFEEKFWKSKSAESFYNNLPANKDDPMSNVFRKTMQVVLKSRSRSNLNEKLTGLLESNIESEINILEKISRSLQQLVLQPFYWFVWNSLGNNEFISINSCFKKYKLQL